MTFELSVKTLTNGLVRCHVSPGDTMTKVKEKLGHGVVNHMLMLDGSILDDTKTVEYYKLSAYTPIDLL